MIALNRASRFQRERSPHFLAAQCVAVVVAVIAVVVVFGIRAEAAVSTRVKHQLPISGHASESALAD